MRKSGLYLITNKTNGHYYGGSFVNMTKRWRHHKWSVCNERNMCIKLGRAIKKYGIDNFEMKPIIVCSPEILLYYEQRWLDKNVGKPECYNIATSAYAPRLGLHLSEETKRKIGNSHRGMVFSAEGRKNISEAKKGIKLTDEHRKKLSIAKLGNTNSKGLIHSEAHKEKLRLANKGNKPWNTGKLLSEEHRKKISAAQTLRWRKKNALY